MRGHINYQPAEIILLIILLLRGRLESRIDHELDE